MLFSYPEALSFDTHLAGIRELVRVTRGEVRLHPLVDTGLRPHRWSATLRRRLAESGVHTECRAARGAYHPGTNPMLVYRRADPGRHGPGPVTPA